MLNISNLNVSYGVIPVLHDVELEVREGEIVALLGGNGAGKTTLLNAISGVMKSQSGRITFLGKDIQNRPADKIVQSGISQIPEGRKIFPYLTVKENLLMGACTLKAWRKRQEMLEKMYAPLSHPEGAGRTAGQSDERRRTADAGHRPGIDGPAQTTHDR